MKSLTFARIYNWSNYSPMRHDDDCRHQIPTTGNHLAAIWLKSLRVAPSSSLKRAKTGRWQPTPVSFTLYKLNCATSIFTMALDDLSKPRGWRNTAFHLLPIWDRIFSENFEVTPMIHVRRTRIEKTSQELKSCRKQICVIESNRSRDYNPRTRKFDIRKKVPRIWRETEIVI